MSIGMCSQPAYKKKLYFKMAAIFLIYIKSNFYNFKKYMCYIISIKLFVRLMIDNGFISRFCTIIQQIYFNSIEYKFLQLLIRNMLFLLNPK